MKKIFARSCLLLPGLLSAYLSSYSQKKPLDHSVYDGWQSTGEKLISNNGQYVVYTVTPQEGDGSLFVVNPTSGYKKEIPRGYSARITEDSRYAICKIRPLFKDTREAKMRKKKPEEMPKDSLAILLLGADSLIRIPSVRSYKLPEKSAGWLAWLAEKGMPGSAGNKAAPDSLTQLNNLSHLADSLLRLSDSLRNKAAEARTKGLAVLQSLKKGGGKTAARPADEIEEGTTLTLRNLLTGEEIRYSLVADYTFSQKGNALAIRTTRKKDDTLSKALVLWQSLAPHLPGGETMPPRMGIDTIMQGLNDARNFAFDEEATRLAFVAERDSAAKALQKFYKLWYYTPGMDSARLIGDRSTKGVAAGRTISEHYALKFSKNGQRLLLGLAPVRPVKDTTLPDFEKAGLDIWNYKDDELQPQQLKDLDQDLKKSYLAIWNTAEKEILPLGDERFPTIRITGEGDGAVFYTSTDSGKRVARQWQGFSLQDVYALNTRTGERKLIVKDMKGELYPSYSGRYLLLYDARQKGYSVYNSSTGALTKVATDIRASLCDEENDVPDDPDPYGIAGWEKDDKHIYIYDRYEVWRVDPEGRERSMPVNPPIARAHKISFRYVKTDPEEKFIDLSKAAYFRVYSEALKQSTYMHAKFDHPDNSYDVEYLTESGPFLCNGLVKADSADVYLYTRENFSSSPDLYVTSAALDSLQHRGKAPIPGWHSGGLAGIQLSHLNPQQSGYLWGTSELFKWKSYTGRETEGILYKPEGFDSTKKYPMIVYYYERNNNTLNNYQPPSPTPSRLNIPFFVSRGYVVFVPDIWYTKGHPGKNAYDYVMSGTRALIRKGFIDSTKIGLQGQSWGGYQTAYIITQTNLFAAAWAGAPVVNMFSAYGGIRWESGVNRQFQYERSQSRIGATIWERPDLYIENSPLFHLPKVSTPLVIMSNDADGAVPWYQGIEFFTAMRRLNKPVWLLEYNGEAHNLVERRNRKDIQVREQQFFDWLLKGAQAPKWIREGVPATLKGIDWGMGME